MCHISRHASMTHDVQVHTVTAILTPPLPLARHPVRRATLMLLLMTMLLIQRGSCRVERNGFRVVALVTAVFMKLDHGVCTLI
jgi:hypothetical protein